MNRDQFKEKVSRLMEERNIGYDEAFKYAFEEAEKELEERLEKKWEDQETAKKNLINNPESKTTFFVLDEFCTKHQALSVATATLKKIKSYHILSTINAYGKEKWLVVSEYDLTYDDAMQVMESINSDKYSDSEIELIVSEAIPFDIRLG